MNAIEKPVPAADAQELAGADEPKGGLRQAMAWLHTWGGLLAGWLLFAIFFTGSLGVFDEAITRWMKPELATVAEGPEPAWDRPLAVRQAQSFLQQVAPRGHSWSIGLPTAENPFVRVFYEDQQEKRHAEKLDPVSGAVQPRVAERGTEGGHHFVHMHFEFHAGDAGIWLVGFLTMAMLVALVSGVITHKRIFKDFFTFRPGKGQRSWLDMHNALSVLSLPFQFMIAYTGLAIFYAMYMPAAIEAHFPQEGSFFEALVAQPPHREETHVDAPVIALDGLLRQAEQTLGRPARFLAVEHPGDSSAVVRVFGLFDEAEAQGRLLPPGSGRMQFDAVTGAVIDVLMPGERRGSGATATQAAMRTLHFAGFGGATVQWLYFVLGLAGAAMMATGAILFSVKRRQRSLQEFGAQTARVYRLVEVLNVAAIAGLMVACVAFFWLNRLLPLDIAQRAEWEVRGFFAVWAALLLHASLRPAPRAWVEQLALGAALCLALPLLNWATTGRHFVAYFAAGDWLRFGVEATVLGCGALCALGAVLLARRQQQPARAPRGASKRLEGAL